MNLDNYVPVNERLIQALERWPDLRVQETGFEIQRIEDQIFLVCQVTVWRSADDPFPAIASAAEPFPGRSNFTRLSERMVGFTSALGRALGYLGIGIAEGIASRNEVEARRSPQNASRQPRKTETTGNPSEGPTDAQRRMLRALGYVSDPPATKRETSALIDRLKADAMGPEGFDS